MNAWGDDGRDGNVMGAPGTPGESMTALGDEGTLGFTSEDTPGRTRIPDSDSDSDSLFFSCQLNDIEKI